VISRLARRAIGIAIVVATSAACDKPDEGVALGWRPIAVGQRIELVTYRKTTALRLAGDTHRKRTDRFEVLAVEGERASRVRYDCSLDEHVVAGKVLPPVVGTFDITRSGEAITVIKQGGEASELEKRDVTGLVTPILESMQLQRGFFTHRFKQGDRYTPTPDERRGLGLPDGSRMTATLASHDDAGMVLRFDGESRFEPARNGIARAVVTGTFDASTDQRRLDTVTDTDLFDGNGQKIGHDHYESKQTRLD